MGLLTTFSQAGVTAIFLVCRDFLTCVLCAVQSSESVYEGCDSTSTGLAFKQRKILLIVTLLVFESHVKCRGLQARVFIGFDCYLVWKNSHL